MKRTLNLFLIFSLFMVILSGCAPKNADSPEENEAPEDFILGEWTDNVYSNEFLKIQLPLPDQWTIVTKEELANVMEIGTEFLNDDMQFAAEAAKLKTIYDMGISIPGTNSSILLCVENLSMSLGGTSMDEDKYLETVEEQLSVMESIPYIIDEVSEEMVAGQTYKTLSTQIDQTDFCQKYLVKKEGKYMIAYICTYEKDNEGAVADALSSITAQ